MALLYHRTTVNKETSDLDIRRIDEDGFIIALSFPDEEDEHAVTEILLTRDEVVDIHDAVFNR